MIVQTLTCGSLLLLSILLAINPLRFNTIANRWLSLFIICIFSALLDVVFFKSGSYLEFPHLRGLSELFMFAMAPALYLSVVYFTSSEHKFKIAELFHFLPCLLFLLYQLPYFLMSSDAKHFMQEHPMPPRAFDTYRIILLTLSIKVQFLVYWLLAFFRIRRHQRNIRMLTSNLQPVNLKWLYYLLFFLLAMYLLWLNTSYFHITFADRITAPAYLLASFFIAFYALKQGEVFAFSEQVLNDIDQIFEDRDQRVKPDRFDAEQVQAIKLKIQTYMTETEIFLEPGLSLPTLAKAIGFTVHDLSFVINKGFDQNFYQFINSCRLEKAKIMLLSDEYRHLNIAGISSACGFNSKTVFNTAFKDLVGLTPSVYKKNAA